MLYQKNPCAHKDGLVRTRIPKPCAKSCANAVCRAFVRNSCAEPCAGSFSFCNRLNVRKPFRLIAKAI